MSKVQFVQAMEGAALAGDWELFKSFFSDDVYYRVGNTTEVRGTEAIINYLQTSFTNGLAIKDLQVRSAWETPDTVVLELNMGGLRVRDQKNVTYPCVDVYRFRNDKIADWRVFAIEPTYIR